MEGCCGCRGCVCGAVQERERDCVCVFRCKCKGKGTLTEWQLDGGEKSGFCCSGCQWGDGRLSLPPNYGWSKPGAEPRFASGVCVRDFQKERREKRKERRGERKEKKRNTSCSITSPFSETGCVDRRRWVEGEGKGGSALVRRSTARRE